MQGPEAASGLRRSVVEFNTDTGESDSAVPGMVGGGEGGSVVGGGVGLLPTVGRKQSSSGGGQGGGARGQVSDSIIVTLYNLDRLSGILEVNSDGEGRMGGRKDVGAGSGDPGLGDYHSQWLLLLWRGSEPRPGRDLLASGYWLKVWDPFLRCHHIRWRR